MKNLDLPSAREEVIFIPYSAMRAAVPLQQEDLGRAAACSPGPAPTTVTNSAVLPFHTTPQATASSLVKRGQIILALTIS